MTGLLERESRCSHDYIRELEEERRKIEAFRRELPLCLQLISQAIEIARDKMIDNVEEMRTSGSPVLEEFIPLKPSSSSGDGSEATVKKMTPDWLRSGWLWNQEPDAARKVEPPTEPRAVNLRKIGGAFKPFKREKEATSSVAASGGDFSGIGGEKEKGWQSQPPPRPPPHRKVRRCWSAELHRRFLNALHQLGGSHLATPKQIRELMKVDGLTNDEVKSHLQKYRVHKGRPTAAVQNRSSSSSPAPQYVLVGGFLVPPPGYSAAAAAVAEARLQRQQQQQDDEKSSDAAHADDDDAAKSSAAVFF